MIADSILAGIHRRLAAELAPPTGRHVAIDVSGHTLGWVAPARAERLARFHDCFELRGNALHFVASLTTPESRTAALLPVTLALAEEGALSPWRNERYAAAARFDAPPAFLLERAAARYFGIRTYAAHVNGLVRRHGEWQMWIARRSATKAIDPGMLDNLVGGGIAANASIHDTVIKEAWEEAGIGAPLARSGQPVGIVDICREQPDGLQRDTIYAHDLVLPGDFVPTNQDGEVVDYRCVPLAEAARLVALPEGEDVVTADASLVIVDCLLRLGAIATGASEHAALAALRQPQSGYAPTPMTKA